MHSAVAMRGDPIVWIGAAACAGALALAAPLATGLAGASIALLLFWQRRQHLAVVAGLAFFVALGRAELRVAAYEAARTRAVEAGPVHAVIRGVVARSPVALGGALRVVIRGESGLAAVTPGLTTLTIPSDVVVARGDSVVATASLAPPYRFWNDADPRPASARRGIVLSGGADDLVVEHRGFGIGNLIDRGRARLRERIVATFPPDTAPMARALVLGEDDLVDSDSKAFRQSGLAHLLAVSGMHLVLVVMGLVAAIRALLVRAPPLADRVDVGRVAAAIGLPVAWLYADLAGGSGSAIRAAWMCSVVLLARALGRRPEPWRALGLSLVAMAAFDPLVAFDISFVLSALATAGLMGLGPLIATRLERLPAILAKPLATSLAATIACSPAIATITPELPLGGLIANIVAVPLGEAAALPLCLLHGLLDPWPDAERGCALAASGALVMVRIVARAFAWATIPVPSPTPGQLATIAVMAAALASERRWQRPLLGLCTLGLVMMELGVRIHPHGVLRVTFLDVGQGDAALIDLPDGSAMLIDGGGLVGSPVDVGERVIAPLLSARRRTRLAAVVLSHPHPDHFLGLVSGLARVRTDAFWDTGQGEDEGSKGPYAELLARMRARGVAIRRPAELCGAREIGGARVEILAPCPVNLDRGPNDNSFVIRVSYGRRSVLFVGDAEHTEEMDLLSRGPPALDVSADILKIGHHGSRTSSTPAFLTRVHPQAAIISCGVRNHFGHPYPTTLEHLDAAGIRVYRTDRDGAITVLTDGQSLSTTPTNGRFRYFSAKSSP